MEGAKSRLPAPGVGLEELVDVYLVEKMELRGISLKRAARSRAHLVGVSGAIGFTQFLQCVGMRAPSARDLVRSSIGAYNEFLIQHHGVIRCAEAMRSLRSFWLWCKRNGLTRDQRMPETLRMKAVKKPWRVEMRISDEGQVSLSK
jgi:hypothetical protein